MSNIWANLLTILVGGLLVNNFVMNRFLGCCPFLGVSKKLETAFGMGMAVTFVMAVASLVACAYLQNRRIVFSVLKAGSLNRAFWKSSISFTSSGAAFFPGPSCQVVHHRWPS